ncbi:MAG: DUF4405 domain-containing protein [Solirubrobacterales bacterium]
MSKTTGFLQRSLVTPLVTATFAVVGLSGVLMLLEVKNAAIKEFHEMVGILFVVAAAFHLVLNWSCFLSYLRKPLTITLGIVTTVLIVLMFTGGQGGGPRGGPHAMMAIAQRVETVSLAQASPLFGVNAEQSLAILRGQGLRVENESDRIADIARTNGKRADEIINLLMSPGEQRREH